MADRKKKLTFAVSRGLATTGVVLVMSGCGPGAISNPAPPDLGDDCCVSVNPAPDFGDDMDDSDMGTADAGDTGTTDAGDAGTTDADDGDAETDADLGNVDASDGGDETPDGDLPD